MGSGFECYGYIYRVACQYSRDYSNADLSFNCLYQCNSRNISTVCQLLQHRFLFELATLLEKVKVSQMVERRTFVVFMNHHNNYQ